MPTDQLTKETLYLSESELDELTGDAELGDPTPYDARQERMIYRALCELTKLRELRDMVISNYYDSDGDEQSVARFARDERAKVRS